MYSTTKTSNGWQVNLPINGEPTSFETNLEPLSEGEDYAKFDLVDLYKEATTLLEVEDYISLEALLSIKTDEASPSIYEEVMSIDNAVTLSLFNSMWAEVGQSGGANKEALRASYLKLVEAVDEPLKSRLIRVFEACGFNYEV